MNDIAFHGTLDPASFAGAVRRTKAMRRLTIGVSIVLAVGIAASIAGDWRSWAPAIVLCVFVLVGLFRATGTQARKQLAANKTLQGPIRGVARESGIEINGDYTTANYPWSVLHRHEVAGDVMLLYVSPRIAHILPRSFFGSDAEWDAFRTVVAANVPAKVKQRSLVKTIAIWIVIIVLVFLLWSLFEAGR
ncbi:MAG TPA: YcxB family protein [Thermoanaerobaculia bacterium]|nr:YcxB family protein [Thermoanaerobaculia bacterium]